MRQYTRKFFVDVQGTNIYILLPAGGSALGNYVLDLIREIHFPILDETQRRALVKAFPTFYPRDYGGNYIRKEKLYSALTSFLVSTRHTASFYLGFKVQGGGPTC